MMFRTYFLTAFLMASVAADDVPMTVVRRLLDNTVFTMDDFACSLKGASSESDCIASDGGCTFCPMGSIAGICLSSQQGTMVNMADLPHLRCGTEAGSTEDAEFWDNLLGCEMASTTSNDCLDTPHCTWCEVEEPKFGVCVTEEALEALITLAEDEADEEDINEVRSACSTTNRDSQTPGLLDTSCTLVAAYGSEEDCVDSIDLFGKACIWMNVDGVGSLCVSETQGGVLQYALATLGDLGIDVGEFVGAFGSAEEEGPHMENIPADEENS